MAQAEQADWEDLPPPALERAPSGFEPEVVIAPSKGEEQVREYRSNGVVYMIEVTPKNGLTYYLVDTDGDGSLETRQEIDEPEVLVPRWVLFRWK